MSKKIIGIPGWDVKAGEHFGVTIPYLSYLTNFDAEVLIITPGSCPKVDLVVLPGGADVDTTRYNEFSGYHTGKPNTFLESFDRYTLPRYVRDKTPIFGICRGLQTLNVLFGGTLHQNIFTGIHGLSKDADDIKVHTLHYANEKGEKGSSAKLEGNNSVWKVGSWHHQAVKDLGENLVVDFFAEDGGVEAISHTELPIRAVQWHPERCHDGYSYNTILELLNP